MPIQLTISPIAHFFISRSGPGSLAKKDALANLKQQWPLRFAITWALLEQLLLFGTLWVCCYTCFYLITMVS